ncbi:MAG: hypothetical protein R3F56_01650 [Planctomycetota bacterium]
MNIDEQEARALVRRAVIGDLPVDAHEVQQALRQFPGLRGELDSLREAQRILDAAGAHERSVLSKASSIDVPPMDTEGIVRRLAAASPPAGRRRSWGMMLVAAVLVAAVAWWMRSETSPPERARGILDREAATIEITSCEPVAGGFELVWRDKEHAAHYKVHVAGAGLDRHSEQIDRPQWTFSAESTAGWPDAVTFTVQGFDDLGGRSGRSAPTTVAWPPR